MSEENIEKDLLADEELDKEPEGEEINWEDEARRARATAKRYHSSHKELMRLQRQEQENKTILPEKEMPPQKEKTEFGLDEVNFLYYKGIAEEDFPYVLQELNSTGKRLQDLIKFKYLQDELKDRTEQRKVQDALPEGTKRGGGTIGRDTVDYWLAKGELPPWSQRKLRQDVVNARIKQEEQKTMFTDNPLV